MNPVADFVKRFRASRDLSLDALAERTGVSRSMLCQIELGKTSPTLAILTKLADGMGVRLGDLVDPERGNVLYRRSSVDESQVTRSKDKSFECALLTAESPNRQLELFRFAFSGTGRHRSPGHGKNAREYLFVEDGELELRVGEETFRLEAGDLLEFRSFGPHEYVQTSTRFARGLCVVYYGSP